MTDEQLRNLTKSAHETIDEINLNKPLTPNSYMLLGASLAILQHGKSTSTSTEDEMAIDLSVANDIEDELGDAERYIKRYADTKDIDYLQMAFDETSHGLKFIKAMHDSDEKREYMARHDQIVDRIKAYGMTV